MASHTVLERLELEENLPNEVSVGVYVDQGYEAIEMMLSKMEELAMECEEVIERILKGFDNEYVRPHKDFNKQIQQANVKAGNTRMFKTGHVEFKPRHKTSDRKNWYLCFTFQLQFKDYAKNSKNKAKEHYEYFDPQDKSKENERKKNICYEIPRVSKSGLMLDPDLHQKHMKKFEYRLFLNAMKATYCDQLRFLQLRSMYQGYRDALKNVLVLIIRWHRLYEPRDPFWLWGYQRASQTVLDTFPQFKPLLNNFLDADSEDEETNKKEQ